MEMRLGRGLAMVPRRHQTGVGKTGLERTYSRPMQSCSPFKNRTLSNLFVPCSIRAYPIRLKCAARSIMKKALSW
jgi:hypothetical protein